LKEEILQLLWQHTPASIKNTQPEKEIKACLRYEAEQINNYINSDELALKNYEWCQKQGSTPKDFKFRWLQLNSKHKILTSIRYEGGNKNHPFVEIVLKSFTIDTIEQLNAIQNLLKQEYALFKPERFRFFTPQILKIEKVKDLNLKGDLLFMVGQHKMLKKCTKIYKNQAVKVQKTQQVNWYNWYKSEYAFLFKEQPFLKRLIHIESQKNLQNLADKGYCFELYVKQKLAGIIAFNHEKTLFLNGYTVIEEIVAAEFRGKGLAKYLQQAAIHQLPEIKNAPNIYGYIGFLNLASQKTAMAIGRSPLAAYYFYPIK